MRVADPTMSGMSMGSGYLPAHARDRARGYRIVGVPALAIRVGRLLELWGYRVSRPMDADRAERVLRAQRCEDTARAAREATVTRGWHYNLR